MKRKHSLVILFLFFGLTHAQNTTDARNGLYIPTQEIFRVYVVFAELTGDPLYGQSISGWNAGEMPSNPEIVVDAEVGQNYQTYFSKYYHEISFDKLKIVGDYYPQLIQIPYNSNSSSYNDITSVFHVLKNVTNGQQITTPGGFQFPNDFDLWTLNTNKGYAKYSISDGKVDCIIIYWRANSHIYPSVGNAGNMYSPVSVYSINIANKNGISTYGNIVGNDISVFVHEFSHNIIGDNTFHSGGANSDYNRIYMQNYSGYSILSGWNRINKSYNGWDRYRLGWNNPQKSFTISAHNTNGMEIASDLIYGQTLSSGDSTIYVLQNFATSNDVVRIKLPYLHSESTSVKEQWLWIENHQLLPGTIEYDDNKYGANKQMYKIPAGIYINIQVGNEDFLTYSNSGPNYISPLCSFGNYDFSYSGDKAYMTTQFSNSFSGLSFSSYHVVNSNNDSSLYYVYNNQNNIDRYRLEEKTYLTFNFNGTDMNNNNWASTGYYYLGSVFDAFYQGNKISLSTNPSPIPRLTFMTNINTTFTSLNLNPKNTDNRKIYLNGICIRVLEQMANGDIKISIRWNDFKVENNVRWCGDIVLNEQIDVQQNASVLLDQGLTPVRPINPITFNGVKIFASPTTFSCNNGSEIKIQSYGSLVLKNSSSLIAKSGSTITINSDANVIVESGTTLQLKTGSNLNISGTGNLVVKSGGYLCVESGVNVNLQDYTSLIILEEGANYGANPFLFSSPSCSGSITKTGNGAIADFNQDIFIQNTTINTNRYYGGKNIFIGNHVTTNQQTGDVLITNGAHVIFNGKSITFDAGFECNVGSTYETINH